MAVYLGQLLNGVMVNKFLLDKEKHTMGRHPDNDITIDDTSVSSHHAVVDAREDDYLDGRFLFFIKDLNSTNGTYVNDLPVKAERRLNNHDVVRLASLHLFKFIDEAEDQLGTGTTMDLGA